MVNGGLGNQLLPVTAGEGVINSSGLGHLCTLQVEYDITDGLSADLDNITYTLMWDDNATFSMFEIQPAEVVTKTGQLNRVTWCWSGSVYVPNGGRMGVHAISGSAADSSVSGIVHLITLTVADVMAVGGATPMTFADLVPVAPVVGSYDYYWLRSGAMRSNRAVQNLDTGTITIYDTDDVTSLFTTAYSLSNSDLERTVT